MDIDAKDANTHGFLGILKKSLEYAQNASLLTGTDQEKDKYNEEPTLDQSEGGEEEMPDWLKLFYEPKSITALLVLSGIIFIGISGLTTTSSKVMGDFFIKWGKVFFYLGIGGWSLFIIPSAIRNIKNLNKKSKKKRR